MTLQTRRKKIWYLPGGKTSQTYQPGALSAPSSVYKGLGLPEGYTQDKNLAEFVPEAIPAPEPATLKGFQDLELNTSLSKLYPELFTVREGETPDLATKQQEAYQNVYTMATTDTENFLRTLTAKGRSPESEALLKSFGLGDEDINLVYQQTPKPGYGHPVEETVGVDNTQKILNLAGGFKDFRGLDIAGIQKLKTGNPDKFIKAIRANPAVGEQMLRFMGAGEDEIKKIVTPLKPAFPPAYKRVQAIMTTQGGNKVAYPMTEREWQSMTPAEQVRFEAKPQEWLKEREDWANFRVLNDRIKIIAETAGLPAAVNTPAEQAQLFAAVGSQLLGVRGLSTPLANLSGKELLRMSTEIITGIDATPVANLTKKLAGKFGDKAGEVAKGLKQTAGDALTELKAQPERGSMKLPGGKVPEVPQPREFKIDDVIAYQERRVAKETNPINLTFEKQSLQDLKKAKAQGKTTIPSEYFKNLKGQVEVPPDLARKVPAVGGVPSPTSPPTIDEVTQLKALGWSDKRIAELDSGERASILKKKMTPADAFEASPEEIARAKAGQAPDFKVKQVPGQPEAGLQQGMFGQQKEVRPNGRGVVTQVSMDDQLQLENYRRASEAEGLKATIQEDRVANYTIPQKVSRKVVKGGVQSEVVTTRNASLGSFISIKEGSFPDYFTVKQAKQLLGENFDLSKYEIKGTKDFNHVPRDVALEKIAQDLNMSADEVADRVMAIRAERAKIRDLSRELTAQEAGITEPFDVPEETIQQAADYQQAIDDGVPPAIRPPEPPQALIPPEPQKSMAEVPKDSEIKRIITQSEEQIRQDKPRLVTNLIHKVPGAKQLLEAMRPGLKMTDYPEALTAMVAEQQARAGVHAWATATQIDLMNDLRKTFGNDVLRGGVSKARFLGTAEQAANKITGTLLDMAQNPELYDLSERQLASLVNINIHNDQMLDWVVSNFNADIGHFTPKANGAYLPNVDIGDDVIEYLKSETRAVTQGRGKTRIWPTARDRMGGKTAFTPDLDVEKLLTGLDDFKARAAGGNTYKQAIGGLNRAEVMETTHPELFAKMTGLKKELASLRGSKNTIESNIDKAVDDFLDSAVEDVDLLTLKDDLDVRLKAGIRQGLDMTDIQAKIGNVQDQIDALRPGWKAANLKPYTFVEEGLYRYFPADKAKLIIESRATSNNRLVGLLEKWRAGAFSGDASPFTNQGVLGVLADPAGSLKAAGGGIKSAIEHQDLLRSFKVSALADDISADPYLWSQYAELSGRGIISATPDEYATGWLSKIPKAGKAIDKFNESTYVTVTRGSFNLWKREFTRMVKAGVPELEAKVAAMRTASEVYPLFNSKLAGQSDKVASTLRALPTSISFMTQPASLIAEGSRGIAKLATLQKLTPAESSAAKTLVTMAASVLAVSATSAYASSKARGESDEQAQQAVLDAINPHPMNGKFASIIIGNIRVPLGGPYRSIFRAIYPAQVKGIPFPIPFAGVPMFFKNRISPAIRTQLDLLPGVYGQPQNAVDYNRVQIFNTKDGSVFENILRGLEYEFENVLPLTLGTIAEAKREGDKFREPLLQEIIGQFAGVNPVLLDNTYIDRQIKQLGMPKETEAKPFTIQKDDIYNTKDAYGDISGVLKNRTGEGFKDKPFTQAVERAMEIKTEADTYLNIKLTDLTDGQWALLQERQGLSDATEFDKINPELAKISQREFVLLQERQAITDKKKLAEFDKAHPELALNKRDEWLKSNPDENALLAVMGQAKILTPKAYESFKKLVTELDIPDSALPERTLPPEGSLDTHWKYQDMVKEGKHGSWEAQLMLAKDEEYRKWAGLKLTDTPIASLELKIKNRDLYDKIQALADSDSPDYVADEKARAEARAKLETPEYKADWRRIEAIEKGNPDMADAHVAYGKMTDEEGVGSSSAEVMLYRVDNPDYEKFRTDAAIWGDQALKPIDQSKIPIWRIDVKYQKQDTEYAEILKANEGREESEATKAYLAEPEHKEYRLDRLRRKAMELSNPATKERFPTTEIENFVAFNELPVKGKRRDRFLLENPDFAQAMHTITGMDLPTKAPDVAYDDIYDQYKDSFDTLEGLGDNTSPSYIEDVVAREEARDGLRFNPDGAYTDFGLAEIRRAAYSKYVPPEHIQDYQDYYQIIGEGKPDNWTDNEGQPLPWYEDDWWMMEHPEFYKNVYLGLLGNERKNYTKVPTREVFRKLLEYANLPTDYWRDQFRLNNPDFDEWGVLSGKFSKSMKEQKANTKLSSRDRTLMEIEKIQTETKKRLAGLAK